MYLKFFWPHLIKNVASIIFENISLIFYTFYAVICHSVKEMIILVYNCQIRNLSSQKTSPRVSLPLSNALNNSPLSSVEVSICTSYSKFRNLGISKYKIYKIVERPWKKPRCSLVCFLSVNFFLDPGWLFLPKVTLITSASQLVGMNMHIEYVRNFGEWVIDIQKLLSNVNTVNNSIKINNKSNVRSFNLCGFPLNFRFVVKVINFLSDQKK